MLRRKIVGPLVLGTLVILAVSASWAGAATPTQALSGGRKSAMDTPNTSGVLRTITLDGTSLDLSNAFFLSLGSNGRSCASCHVPKSGWAITPAEVQDRFDRTRGLDPIFRLNDGSNSPRADISTIASRRKAFSMLLSKGLIRVGLPIPAGAEFTLDSADDPYGFASTNELSLFRRPMPTTNLRFLTAVMWDGRESMEATGTHPILAGQTQAQNEDALFADLMHQASDATIGHAQGTGIIDSQVLQAIVRFELNLATAQQVDRGAGPLDSRRARGGPAELALQSFYVTINDVLGADALGLPFDNTAMTLFDDWRDSRDPRQAAIARGAAVFNTKPINIAGVGGLNDALGLPTIAGHCTSCHDSPNVGNHSVALAIDIGIGDAERRTPDMPLYTLRNRSTGESRAVTDPGRALLTGKWADIGKFKGPVLRGLASRPPYFHDGSAADLSEAVDFYDGRFAIGFTSREKADLIAFLKSL